jgi:hypothetical protein
MVYFITVSIKITDTVSLRVFVTKECHVAAILLVIPPLSTSCTCLFAVTQMMSTCGLLVYRSVQCQGVWLVQPSTVLLLGHFRIYDMVTAFGMRTLVGPVLSHLVSKTVLPEGRVTSYMYCIINQNSEALCVFYRHNF